MTVTSGPGFSLMMENIGLAAMMETPCVVVNVQRGGPSTGLPTMVGQADVMQARWGSHGDYEIIALCPQSPQEAFDLTIDAFNLSETLPRAGAVHDGRVRRPHDREGGHPARRRDRGRAAAADRRSRPRSTCPTSLDGRPGARVRPRRRRLPLPHHRPDPRRARLPGDERRVPGDAASAGWWTRSATTPTRSCASRRTASRTPRSWWSPTASPPASRALAIEMAREQGVKVGFLRLITVWPFPEKRIRELAGSVRRLRRAGDQLRPDGPRGRALRRRPGAGRPGAATPAAACTTPRRSSRRSWRRRHERRPMNASWSARRRRSTRWRRTCAWTACPTSGARAAASAPRSSASPRRSRRPGSTWTRSSVVSGIGCTGRVAGYLKLDSFHTTHGRAIPFATGLKLAGPS